MKALLELCGVSKRFVSGAEDLLVLSGVGLAVLPGETLAVTGPSGSGKSTLLGVMAGLERPSEGKILFEGKDLSAWDEDRLARWRRGNVGFIFQAFRLVPSLTALENVSLPLEILGARPDESSLRARELLETLGLGGRAGHFPHELSGGEQQRVAIARAYVHAPRLILADEPTGSLDRATAARVLEALLALNTRKGTALVVVTHDPAVAGKLSRSLALEGGRVKP